MLGEKENLDGIKTQRSRRWRPVLATFDREILASRQTRRPAPSSASSALPLVASISRARFFALDLHVSLRSPYFSLFFSGLLGATAPHPQVLTSTSQPRKECSSDLDPSLSLLNKMDDNQAIHSGAPEDAQAVTGQDAPADVTASSHASGTSLVSYPRENKMGVPTFATM